MSQSETGCLAVQEQELAHEMWSCVAILQTNIVDSKKYKILSLEVCSIYKKIRIYIMFIIWYISIVKCGMSLYNMYG